MLRVSEERHAALDWSEREGHKANVFGGKRGKAAVKSSSQRRVQVTKKHQRQAWGHTPLVFLKTDWHVEYKDWNRERVIASCCY